MDFNNFLELGQSWVLWEETSMMPSPHRIAAFPDWLWLWLNPHCLDCFSQTIWKPKMLSFNPAKKSLIYNYPACKMDCGKGGQNLCEYPNMADPTWDSLWSGSLCLALPEGVGTKVWVAQRLRIEPNMTAKKKVNEMILSDTLLSL